MAIRSATGVAPTVQTYGKDLWWIEPDGVSVPKAGNPAFMPAGSRVGAAMDVLLVEDDAVVRECLREALADAGWRVGEAADAGKALDRMAADGMPGVIVTDLVLGSGMSGAALIVAAHLRWPQVHAVLISGNDVAEPTLGPGDRFLCKPFQLGDLVQAVSELIAGKAAANLNHATP